eukprot:GHVH01007973.1.p1 GENE.GHVH01007973.1~~GHVH01007973.1.p1  ORF type:complete len:388 (+),score=44.30 GHVH01007973.1:72-1235(+)
MNDDVSQLAQMLAPMIVDDGMVIKTRGGINMMPSFRKLTVRPHVTEERGFSFAPVGLLMPYMLSVALTLQDFGRLTTNTYIAGGSAGAIVTLLMASGMSRERMIELLFRFFYKCHKSGTFRKMSAYLHEIISEEFTEDMLTNINERPAHVTISYSVVDPATRLPVDGRFVSQFKDLDDLGQVLGGSCHIPLYLDNTFCQPVRGEMAVDAFFSVNLQTFGCPPTGLEGGVDVSVIPFNILDLNKKTILPNVIWSESENNIISPHLDMYFTTKIKHCDTLRRTISHTIERRKISHKIRKPSINNDAACSHLYGPMEDDDILLWVHYSTVYYPTPDPDPGDAELCSVLRRSERKRNSKHHILKRLTTGVGKRQSPPRSQAMETTSPYEIR